jgi:hypothetical protein
MSHMFGHTWASQYGVDPAGAAADTWSTALAGITPEQIALGLQTTLALGAEWPPTAPRFRAMCMGIPSIAQVRYEMRFPRERTPFMRQMWAFLDSHRFASDDSDRAVAEAYELTCTYVMRGGELPDGVVISLERQRPPKPVPASDATARAELERMAAIFRADQAEAAANA